MLVRPMLCMSLAALITLVPGIASGQSSYPNKAIRIVGSAAGGGSDYMIRPLAQGLFERLGKPVVIENRGGAAAAIEIVAHAQPDGYTLLYYGSILWTLPLLQDKVSYNVQRDFAPITMVSTQTNFLLLHPSVAANSVKELIALAKARPHTLNYSSGGSGSSGHLAGAMLSALAGIDIVRVPYKGSGPALTALIGGEVQMLMASAANAASQVKSGRVKALAVTSAKRSLAFPELPTIAESGVPGYDYAQVNGILAPAGTPAAIINRVQREAAQVLNQPEMRDRLIANAIEPVGSTPQEFAAKIKDEVARLGKVIKDAGIRGE